MGFLLAFFLVLPVWAKGSHRPPNQYLIWVQKLSKDRPIKLHAAWWEVTYQSGQRNILQQPPKTQESVRYLRFHVNDREKAVSSHPGMGGMIKISPLETVTYVYPAFWTGNEWLLESELKTKNSEAYHKLFLRATRNHHSVIRLQHDLQRRTSIGSYIASIAHIRIEKQNPQKTAQELDYLNRQEKMFQQLLLKGKSELNTSYPIRVFPKTLVKAYRFQEAIIRTEKRSKEMQRRVNSLEKEMSKYVGAELQLKKIELARFQTESQLILENIEKLKQTQASFKSKGWLMDF